MNFTFRFCDQLNGQDVSILLQRLNHLRLNDSRFKCWNNVAVVDTCKLFDDSVESIRDYLREISASS